MRLEIQCPMCSADHEVTVEYTRPEPSVGYGGGWEVEDGPSICHFTAASQSPLTPALQAWERRFGRPECGYHFTDADRAGWEQMAEEQARDDACEAAIARYEERRR